MTAPHLPHWPRVVAESLAGVLRPLATTARPIRTARSTDVWNACGQASAPALSAVVPPPFLMIHQITPWRRVMAALDMWRGALLVEPVGAGKSWIAMAAALGFDRVTVVGPALLRAQWQEVAAAVGLTIEYWSAERLSRGSLPRSSPALVIVDEAHRFRNASTRRVRTLAPFLIGRRVLLLTATPLVNRLEELVTLLRLCLPEDALRQDGIATLGEIAYHTEAPIALRRVVIRSDADAVAGYPASVRRLPLVSGELERGARAVEIVRQVTARHRAASGRLLSIVLLDAAASSDAALLQALRRYRALLRQARDAGGSDRTTLRRFAGEQLEQCVLWELVGIPEGTITLPVDDLALVERVVGTFTPADSWWLAALRVFLTQGPPVICFTRHRATASLLRTTLGDGTAWITGDSAGIGPHRMAREAILAAFGPDRASWALRRVIPRCLVATDVAAEGLNLQGAGRLVHIDLPWTAMRIAQREGRLLRIGQQHESVEIILRQPPGQIEASLQRTQAVARKGSLSARWLDQLAWHTPRWARRGDGIPCATERTAHETPPRDVVMLEVTDHATSRIGLMTLIREADGEWDVTQPGAVRGTESGTSDLLPGDAHDRIAACIESATQFALRRLRRTSGWMPPRLVTRIHGLARKAAWARDSATVRRLDRTLRWCNSAPTLGQRMLVDRLAAADDEELMRYVAPEDSPAGPYSIRVVGVVLFRSAGGTLRSGDVLLPDHPLRPRRDAD